jgi:DNA-binding NtrC family response regulator
MMTKVPHVLLVDDDPDFLILLEILFSTEGFRVTTAANGSQAITILKREFIDLVVTDFLMPNIDGLDVLASVKASGKPVPVILITGHGSIEKAVNAIKAGAFDYLTKPLNEEKLLITAHKALEKRQLILENLRLKEELARQNGFDKIISQHPKILRITETLRSTAETDATVLLTGESGTGKELFSRSIHYQSKRRYNPFIAINCAAIPSTLLESEFFGHEKGAFTGAFTRRDGKFEQANNGTLLLDEIGEMSLELQAKLLRVIEKQEFERVGGNETIKCDVRIIAATNKNLLKAVQEKKFREDLFYRLNVISVHIPPLRERKSDIALLIEHFLKKYSQKYGRPPLIIPPETLHLLEEYYWPGNIRELENCIERWVITVQTGRLLPDNLSPEIRNFHQETSVPSDQFLSGTLTDKVKELEIQMIKAALRETRGIQSRAAKLLGITDRILGYKISQYDINVTKYRKAYRS